MRVLSRALVLLLTVVALSGSTATPAVAADDYPWRADTTSGADDFGFTKRQCVSFVAWRLAQRGTALSNDRDGWGDAAHWDDAAWRLGHRRGYVPVAGAVAHWNAGEASALHLGGSHRPNGTMRAGAHGHVAYVQRVHADGSATVSHYNARGDRTYSLSRVRAPRYLYVEVTAPRAGAVQGRAGGPASSPTADR